MEVPKSLRTAILTKKWALTGAIQSASLDTPALAGYVPRIVPQTSKALPTTVKSQKDIGADLVMFKSLQVQKCLDLCTTLSAKQDTRHGAAATVAKNAQQIWKIYRICA